MEKILTKDIVADICNEIERQWEHHLLIRAAFPAKTPEDGGPYESPPYYKHKAVSFAVCRPVPMSDVMKRGYKDLGAWANQNYVIRLFGILEENSIIKAGKKLKNPYTEIVALLRHSVGAHSRGVKNPERSDSEKVTKLIQKHLDDRALPDTIKTFNLSIDTVLEKLKIGCQDFVRSLENQEVPSKKTV
jgi:hypothetical protein